MSTWLTNRPKLARIKRPDDCTLDSLVAELADLDWRWSLTWFETDGGRLRWEAHVWSGEYGGSIRRRATPFSALFAAYRAACLEDA